VARSHAGMVRRRFRTAILRKIEEHLAVRGGFSEFPNDKIVLAILGFAAILPAGVASA